MNKRDLSKEVAALLLVILFLLLALSFGSQWLPALGTGWTTLLYVMIYFVPIFIYIKTHRYKMKTALRMKHFPPRYWLFVLLFGLSVCLISTLINAGCSALFRSVLPAAAGSTVVDLFGGNWRALVLTTVLLPALAEELLLRGLVQGEYEKYGITIGVLLTSLIFALFHTNLLHLPALFIAGVFYGVLTVLFRSVWPAVLAHAVNNAVVLFLGQNKAFLQYIFQDRLFVIIVVLTCFFILIFTLKMLETVIHEQAKRTGAEKKSTRGLAYGDPVSSPALWLFALLCVGKMIYNIIFKM